MNARDENDFIELIRRALDAKKAATDSLRTYDAKKIEGAAIDAADVNRQQHSDDDLTSLISICTKAAQNPNVQNTKAAAKAIAAKTANFAEIASDAEATTAKAADFAKIATAKARAAIDAAQINPDAKDAAEAAAKTAAEAAAEAVENAAKTAAETLAVTQIQKTFVKAVEAANAACQAATAGIDAKASAAEAAAAVKSAIGRAANLLENHEHSAALAQFTKAQECVLDAISLFEKATPHDTIPDWDVDFDMAEVALVDAISSYNASKSNADNAVSIHFGSVQTLGAYIKTDEDSVLSTAPQAAATEATNEAPQAVPTDLELAGHFAAPAADHGG